MHPRTPLGQFLIFILALVIMNAVLYLVGAPFRFSIIGSIIASALVAFLTRLFYQRSE